MKACICFLLLLPLSFLAQTVSLKDSLRILALGDSYTIGESVSVNERWPVQLADSLLKQEIVTDTLSLIATTGWRTDELLNAITGKHLENYRYNLVALLIGVNNQFQSKPFSQYVNEFPALLDSAIRYAGGEKAHVFVLSIPDYAFTPFGQQNQDPAQISAGIDLYNTYNTRVADSMGVTYFDITSISRQGLQDPSYVAGDGLHPSGTQYAQWVELLLTKMHPEILTGISSPARENIFVARMYPNPAAQQLRISLPGPAPAAQVKIFDAGGKLVLQQNISGVSCSLNLADLPAGFYTCNIYSGGSSVAKKLIVTKE